MRSMGCVERVSHAPTATDVQDALSIHSGTLGSLLSDFFMGTIHIVKFLGIKKKINTLIPSRLD
jgi:hypothetical protein